MITKEILYGWWFPWTPIHGIPGVFSIGFGYFRLWLFIDAPSYSRHTLKTGIALGYKPNFDGSDGDFIYCNNKEWIFDEHDYKDKYLSKIQREIE